MVGLTTPSWRIATPFIRGRRPSHRREVDMPCRVTALRT
jgi:hypothetical protein